MSFTLQTLSEFKHRLIDKLLFEADTIVRPKIPSATLRAALQRRIDFSSPNVAGDLFLSHYWSVMVHDGTRSFGPREAQFLVYFVHEGDDPRKPRGERAADDVRLSKEDFREGLAENRRLQHVNPGGGSMQHMVIVKTPDGRPGRVPARSGAFFFTDSADVIAERLERIAGDEFQDFLNANVIKETITARFVI